jgi:hypothetical protein
MTFTIDSAQSIFPNTQVASAVPATVESFSVFGKSQVF